MQQQVKPVIPNHQAVTIKLHATLAGVDAANGQCWYESARSQLRGSKLSL